MKRTTLVLLASFLLSSTVACATKLQVATDAPALGSDAKIVVKKTKTGNYAVTIDVTNLAPAPRLDAQATAFVVWLVAKDLPAVRAGVLEYDEGDRRGALEATSPNASFTVLITLEKEPGPASPNGKGIVSAAIAAR